MTAARRPRVAVAAESAALRRLLFIWLEERGFAVSRAANGMELAHALDQHPDMSAVVVKPGPIDGTLGLIELSALPLVEHGIPVIVLCENRTFEPERLAKVNAAAVVDWCGADSLEALLRELHDLCPSA